MIKFFRKIRQDLLTTGKNTKYLQYAIGEIVLVVVGILIALAINNWNEDRKKREFEITILENIQEDILADKVDLVLNSKYIEQTLINEQLLLDYLLKRKNDQTLDSISFTEVLGIDMIAVFHNASFNNLQNNEVGLITNNELYKKITRFYDFYVTALQELEVRHESANTYNEKFEFFRKHFKVIDKKTNFNISSDMAWTQDFNRYNFVIKNKKMLQEDDEFQLLLAESLFHNSIMFDFYNQLFSKLEDLNNDINEELSILK